MFLEKLLISSENKYLNHFNFDKKSDKFTFFTDKSKTVFSCEKSFSETLVEYLQSLQLFPPYLSWKLGDMISEHQDEYGYAFIDSKIIDFNLDTDKDILEQLFSRIGYKVNQNSFCYDVFDESNQCIADSLSFYQCLSLFLYKLKAIDEDMLKKILN